MFSRRAILQKAGGAFAATVAAVAVPSLMAISSAQAKSIVKVKGNKMSYPFTLPELPYAHNALAPVIDEETMMTHHGKHHQAYVDKLNVAVKELPDFQDLTLVELLQSLDKIPEAQRAAVRNNGGGHLNHSMFWQIMAKPNSTKPRGKIAAAIDAGYGSFDEFKKQFNSAGEKQFGSGWVFLTSDSSGKLNIVPLPNQETPVASGTAVLFGNDVWEHAYYITYRNRRPEYLQAWWQVVNWDKIEERYAAAMDGKVFI